MLRIVLVAAIVAAAAPASALTQLQRLAQQELREYGFAEVDVTRLSSAQLAEIRAIANAPGRESSKRGQMRSTLRGPYTLRSALGWTN